MSIDYNWAKAVTEQLRDCQAKNARLRDEADGLTTALQKVDHLEAEIARLRLTDEEHRVLREIVAWGELADSNDCKIVADLLIRHS